MRGADLTARGAWLRLQDHGQDVWFRALRWRAIPAGEVLERHTVVPMPVSAEALKKEQARVEALLQAKAKAAARTKKP